MPFLVLVAPLCGSEYLHWHLGICQAHLHRLSHSAFVTFAGTGDCPHFIEVEVKVQGNYRSFWSEKQIRIGIQVFLPIGYCFLWGKGASVVRLRHQK